MELLTIKETAAILKQRRPNSVYDLISRQVFPPGIVIRLGSKSLRINKAALENWLSNGGSLPAELQPAQGSVRNTAP